MSKKLAYVLIFLLAATLIAGIAIGAVVLKTQSDYDKDITLTQDGAAAEEMEFSLEGMYPGQSAEYSIRFGGNVAKLFNLTLSFRSDGETALAGFVDAELELDGKRVKQGSLDDLLDGDAVELPLSARNGQSVLVVRYVMPATVGDEAQELTADFVVEIEVTPAG